jgi:hypothetical protein
MARHNLTISAADRVIAIALALVWIGGSLIGMLVGLRHGLWLVLIIGPLGLWFGILWARVARSGRSLEWREGIWPWRRQ